MAAMEGEAQDGRQLTEQVFFVKADGVVDVEWVDPGAGGLVLAVWRTVGNREIAVRLGAGGLYCG